MYTVIHLISIVIALSFGVFFSKKQGIHPLKSILFLFFSFIVTYLILRLIPWFETGSLGSLNMVKIYAFSPPIYYLASRIFKINFRTACDMHGIWPMILFGLSHLACLIPGCCAGYEYLEGTRMCEIANALTGTNMIPNQIMESVAGLIIAAVMFLIFKLKNYQPNGRLYFIMIIIYGIQRFGWEFLRNNNKIIVFGKMTNATSGDFGLSDLSFYCIAMVLVGIAFLIAFHIIDKKKATE